MQRYNILRQAGADPKTARANATSAAGFVAALTDAGGDPSLYPDLARKLPSGPPRVRNAKNDARAERYRLLRDLGLSGLDASRCSQSSALYELAIGRLSRGALP